MITDPTQINHAFVQLPDVVVIGVEDPDVGVLLVHIELERSRQGCGECGVIASVKDRDLVELVDLALFGRPMTTDEIGLARATIALSRSGVPEGLLD